MPRSSAAKVQSKPGSHHDPDPRSREHEDKATAQQPATSVHPVEPPIEPDDAKVTGTSPSLQRRVLGLNVEGGQAQEHPETPAGQHATGSFTGNKSGGKQR